MKGEALTTKFMFQDYSELLDNFKQLVLKTAEKFLCLILKKKTTTTTTTKQNKKQKTKKQTKKEQN